MSLKTLLITLVFGFSADAALAGPVTMPDEVAAAIYAKALEDHADLAHKGHASLTPESMAKYTLEMEKEAYLEAVALPRDPASAALRQRYPLSFVSQSMLYEMERECLDFMNAATDQMARVRAIRAKPNNHCAQRHLYKLDTTKTRIFPIEDNVFTETFYILD